MISKRKYLKEHSAEESCSGNHGDYALFGASKLLKIENPMQGR